MKKITTENKRKIISYLSSIILHIIILIIILTAGIDSKRVPQINRQMIVLEPNHFEKRNKLQSENENVNDDTKQRETDKKYQNIPLDYEFMSINPADILTDTTELDQLYSEKTLNLSIKYPKGWTFIDQNNKNKLDGVTFWSAEGIYNPPPYIHLEVVEKYLFSPKRYKYRLKYYNYEWYFNDPVNLEGQISQEIYIRTEIDEDFLVKLIMVGEEQFLSFQPKFFALLKSLRINDFIF